MATTISLITLPANGLTVDLPTWARLWVDSTDDDGYTARHHRAAVEAHSAIAQAFRSLGDTQRALPHEALAREHELRARTAIPTIRPASQWPMRAQIALLNDVRRS